jgi:hypothetical protein
MPMPIAITFFANQGEEPTLIKIGTAHEAATDHRTPPPAFGPVALRGGAPVHGRWASPVPPLRGRWRTFRRTTLHSKMPRLGLQRPSY